MESGSAQSELTASRIYPCLALPQLAWRVAAAATAAAAAAAAAASAAIAASATPLWPRHCQRQRYRLQMKLVRPCSSAATRRSALLTKPSCDSWISAGGQGPFRGRRSSSSKSCSGLRLLACSETPPFASAGRVRPSWQISALCSSTTRGTGSLAASPGCTITCIGGVPSVTWKPTSTSALERPRPSDAPIGGGTLAAPPSWPLFPPSRRQLLHPAKRRVQPALPPPMPKARRWRSLRGVSPATLSYRHLPRCQARV
mmetsp:Transcript_110408/g.285437  ORF Transcript_110408/g.285437 Transcript_110408/m.285437 type:complete len:257 (+) Transcript_110408:535-1305(+)